MNVTLRAAIDSCLIALVVVCGMLNRPARAADSWARSDSDARYLHHINLYDANNRKITAESNQPYSPRRTCGRCHDYETIAHGWHFNASLPDTIDGRPGEPWIWTEPKTGTQLPLSYRNWEQTYDPNAVGLTSWQIASHFGTRIPGGNLKSIDLPVPADAEQQADAEPDKADAVPRPRSN